MALMEQLLGSVIPELAICIKERQPGSVDEAARLAEICEDANVQLRRATPEVETWEPSSAEQEENFSAVFVGRCT